MESESGTDFQRAVEQIAASFESAFGPTTLTERLNDLSRQATALGRFTDFSNLRDEAGDLICSLMQLCHECGWKPEELIAATLHKIASRSDIYRRLGRKLRVALFQGAFDPIHVGHVEVAKQVLHLGQVDEVWFMPYYEHPTGRSLAQAEHRLEMCRLAIQDQPGLSVFDFEILHRFRGETYHLVKKLLATPLARERCEFSLIVGQEKADTFASWTNYDGLERLIDFVVVPKRERTPRANAWYLKPPHRFLDSMAMDETTSSTEIRQKLRQQDESAASLLSKEVYDYVSKHQLYQDQQEIIARVKSRRVAILHRSFDPPTCFHQMQIERLLSSGFGEVIVCPQVCGLAAGEREHALPIHRAALLSLAFQDLPGVRIDFDDLSFNRHSANVFLEARHKSRGEIWHVIDSQALTADGDSSSTIQKNWLDGQRLWNDSPFLVFSPEPNRVDQDALPPRHALCHSPEYPSSADLRAALYAGESIAGKLTDRVASYVDRHRLFQTSFQQNRAQFCLDQPRIRIVANTKNEKSMALAQQYAKYESESPDLILVLGGDGTMLHAIREHWRSRIPFLGLNTGHLGFLMNERLPDVLENIELVSYTLPMLRVDARASDGTTSWGLAFSDVWLERAEGQSAWLQLDIDGQTRVSKVVGDGMLVATAAGSSAYARAMGAVPVPLNTSTLALAGSNIFQPRFWKPMAISDDSLIRMKNLDESGKRPLRGFIDGIAMGIVQEISVRRSLTAGVEMAFTAEFDPSSRLLRSLFPDTES
jgi:NAD+ kinase